MDLLPPPTTSLHRQLTGIADTLATSADATHSLEATLGGGGAMPGFAASVAPSEVYDVRVAGITDPGVPGKQNQDEFFLYESIDRQTIIAGVFDGHGREMGQIAAKVAAVSMKTELSRADSLARLRVDPAGTLHDAFVHAHQAIEAEFKRHYEEQGWTVEKRPEGYLIRYKFRGAVPMCVHGGTTATVVILLDGRRLVVSNVGDSTAIMVGLGAAGALKKVEDWKPMWTPPQTTHFSGASEKPMELLSAYTTGAPSTSVTLSAPPQPISATSLPSVPAELSSSFMELSADHSPESHTEFVRMHSYRPHSSLPYHPELLFVYDTLSSSKLSCPPIFDVCASSGALAKTERGSYYKNVRCEWATLVATPPHAPFQDALAFTRSLGDLHLQTYGVSHAPETWWMDLTVPAKSAAGADVEAPLVSHPLGLVLCSDGVWDNWKFEEVADFALAPSRVMEAARMGSAHVATNELMAANIEKARANFGPSADNMTAVVFYLFPRAPAAS